MAKKYFDIYTDGGFYKQSGEVKWSFIVIENNEDIIEQQTGNLNAGSGFEVEEAESEAILKAVEYCEQYCGNYRLHTDSMSCLDKIHNIVPNATKNPRFKGIQNIIDKINGSQMPHSIVLKYHKRRSNKWAQFCDDLCYRNIG